jgi:hypothetical protein
MATIARDQLAAELGQAPDAISVVRVEEVEWPNSALGCAAEGQMSLQVITPGYRVLLRANGTDYTFHTDKQRQVIRCDEHGTTQ